VGVSAPTVKKSLFLKDLKAIVHINTFWMGMGCPGACPPPDK